MKKIEEIFSLFVSSENVNFTAVSRQRVNNECFTFKVIH